MSNLLTYPHPLLLQPTNLVNLDGEAEKVSLIVAEMRVVIETFDALGLAANQLGYSKSIIIIVPEKEKTNARVFLNPEITESTDPEFVQESCLSFPGVLARVKRYKGIKVKYLSLENTIQEEEFFDLPGQIAQHEIDHLFGKTLAQVVSPAERARVLRQLTIGKRKIKKVLKAK
jgi:peptide deformylase